MISRVFLLTLLVSIPGCNSEPDVAHEHNIFGPDNRETAPGAAPYRAVGRLDSGCTATLVGRNVILTAAHCIVDNATGLVHSNLTYFRPDYRDGEGARAAFVDYVWLGSLTPEDDRVDDWALARIDQNLGDEFGTLPVQEVAAPPMPYTVSLVGYSQDKDGGNTPYLHRGCYVHQVVEGKWFHDCDSTAGISGAPMLATLGGATYVVGVSVSEYRQGAPGSVTRDQYSADYANVAVPATRFMSAATRIVGALASGGELPSVEGVTERLNPNARTADGGGDGAGGGDDEIAAAAARLAARDTLAYRTGAIEGQLHRSRELTRTLVDFALQLGDERLAQSARKLMTDGETLQETLRSAVGGLLGQNFQTELAARFVDVARDHRAIANVDPSRYERYAGERLQAFQHDLAQAKDGLEASLFR